MKLLTLITLLTSFNVFAISTRNCPETISFKFTEFDLMNRRFLYSEIEALKDLGVLKEVANANGTYNSKCHYRGDKVTAVISGSLRENAIKKATLSVYTHDYIIYTRLADVQKSGLTPKFKFAEIYVYGEYCSWGDCIPNYYPIGNANSISVK